MEKPAENPWPSTLALVLILGIAPVVCGIWLLRSSARRAAQRHLAVAERAVLQVAQERQGVLSAADVAMYTTLSLEEAQETLNRLHLQGLVSIDVTDSGVIVYTVPRFTPPRPETP